MAPTRRSRGESHSGGFAPVPPPSASAGRRVVAVVDSDDPMTGTGGAVFHSAWEAGAYDEDYEGDEDEEIAHAMFEDAHSGWSTGEENAEVYDFEDEYGDYYDEEEDNAETEYEYNYQQRSYSYRRPPSPVEPLAPPPLMLCRFFVLGKCRYGSRCTYSHTLPTETSCGNNQEDDEETRKAQVAATMVDCPFFQRGNCKYGDYCRLRHASQASAAAAAINNQQQHAWETHNAARHATSSASSGGGARAHTAPATSTQPGNQTQEFTCGICFEDIVEQGKYFGLLSCDHCFCLECLRAWRQSKDMEVEVTRACPACRLPSNYIVPSLKFCTGDEKTAAVDAYKRHLAIRECKYFDGTFGSCPFGPNCFYAHRNAGGDNVKHLDRARRSTRRRQRSDSDESFESFASSFASENTLGSRRGGRRGAFASLLDSYSEFLLFLESLGSDGERYDGY